MNNKISERQEANNKNIIVLNGSLTNPSKSTCAYFGRYIQLQFPEHEIDIIHISRNIKKIERDETFFQAVINKIQNSDGVLWLFPVYHYSVPAVYKRFIELIWERKATDAFKEKYAAGLSCSINVGDSFAHNYIHAVCDDLGMKYTDFLSATVLTFTKTKEREKIYYFFENFIRAIDNKLNFPQMYFRPAYDISSYLPGETVRKTDNSNKKIVLVSESFAPDSNLGKMTNKFQGFFSHPIEIINLRDTGVKGDCQSCFSCVNDNICKPYIKADKVRQIYTKMEAADILVFAASVKDRYISAAYKLFIDRDFFSQHIPSAKNKQMAFIFSGYLSQTDIAEVCKLYAQYQESNLVSIISDEEKSSEEIDLLLDSLARNLIYYSDKQYIKPMTFYGVGMGKIVRDFIWGPLRHIFPAVYRYLKENRRFDFPQYDIKTRIFNFVLSVALKIPPVKKGFYKNITEFTHTPEKEIFEKIVKEKTR